MADCHWVTRQLWASSFSLCLVFPVRTPRSLKLSCPVSPINVVRAGTWAVGQGERDTEEDTGNEVQRTLGPGAGVWAGRVVGRLMAAVAHGTNLMLLGLRCLAGGPGLMPSSGRCHCGSLDPGTVITKAVSLVGAF
jgi:hypothetical protein